MHLYDYITFIAFDFYIALYAIVCKHIQTKQILYTVFHKIECAGAACVML